MSAFPPTLGLLTQPSRSGLQMDRNQFPSQELWGKVMGTRSCSLRAPSPAPSALSRSWDAPPGILEGSGRGTALPGDSGAPHTSPTPLAFLGFSRWILYPGRDLPWGPSSLCSYKNHSRLHFLMDPRQASTLSAPQIPFHPSPSCFPVSIPQHPLLPLAGDAGPGLPGGTMDPQIPRMLPAHRAGLWLPSQQGAAGFWKVGRRGSFSHSLDKAK